jgi:pyrroline-5-carboxylate reductase
VGSIAAAVVSAILQGPNGDLIDVVLSPRSTARSQSLAERFRQVRIAPSNQAVVDGGNVVFVSVLPDQVVEVCSLLKFRDDQIVVGLSAGWPPSRLAPHVAPAPLTCQVIPLPMITLGVGPIVLYPGIPDVERLLIDSGRLIVLEREDDVNILSCLSAIMSSFFAFQNAAIDWAAEHGLDRRQATEYVTALLNGLSTEAMEMDPVEISGAVKDHETPGGLNEYIRKSLEDTNVFSDIPRHLEHLYSTRFGG